MIIYYINYSKLFQDFNDFMLPTMHYISSSALDMLVIRSELKLEFIRHNHPLKSTALLRPEAAQT